MNKNIIIITGVLFILGGGYLILDAWWASSAESVSGVLGQKNIREVVTTGRSGKDTTYYLDLYIYGYEIPYSYQSGNEDRIRFYSNNIEVGDNVELHLKPKTMIVWGHSRNGAITIDPSVGRELDYIEGLFVVAIGFVMSIFGIYSDRLDSIISFSQK